MGIESKRLLRLLADLYCEPEQRDCRRSGPAKNPNLWPFAVYYKRAGTECVIT